MDDLPMLKESDTKDTEEAERAREAGWEAGLTGGGIAASGNPPPKMARRRWKSIFVDADGYFAL